MLRGDKKAATALEFALVGGLLITGILAILETGLLWWLRTELQNVAGETARCGAVGYRWGTTTCLDSTTTAAYAINMANTLVFTNAVATSDVTINSSVDVTSSTSICGTIPAVSNRFFAVTVQSSYFTFLPPPFANLTMSAKGCFPIAS
jgi:Flp pilus assembly protein TadG